MRARSCALACICLVALSCSAPRRAIPTEPPAPRGEYELSRAVQRRPQDAAAWERLGWHALTVRGSTPDAARSFETALRLDPLRPASLLGQYVLAEGHADAARALDAARTLLQPDVAPELAPVLLARLPRLEALGLPEVARTELRALLRRPEGPEPPSRADPASPGSAQPLSPPPADAERWIALAGVLLPPAAGPLAEVRPLEALHQSHPAFAHAAAELAAHEPDMNRRAAALRAALAVDPAHVGARYALVRLMLELGFVEQAGAVLETAPARRQPAPALLAAAAQVAAARGRTAAAARLSDEALDLAPAFLPALRLSLRHGAGFRTAAAQAELAARALELAPGDPELLAALAAARSWLGRAQPQEPHAAPPPAERGERAEAEVEELDLDGWLQRAEGLETDGFSSLVLYQARFVTLAESGGVTVRRRMLVRLLRRDPEALSFGLDYSPEEQEVRVLLAERRGAAGERLGGASVSEGPNPLLPSSAGPAYSDHRRLSVAFADARPGDLLDVAVELRTRAAAALPFLGDSFALADGSPTVAGVYELTVPAGITPRVEGFGNPSPRMTVQAAGGGQRFRLEVERVPGVRAEPGMPHPLERLPYVVVSTLGGYPQMADWYGQLAGLEEPLAPFVPAAAAQLCPPGGDGDAARTAARLHDHVQARIRYVGLELGQYAYRPHTPAEVERSRYGDCKDQARLLIELARGCGLPAEMVLVRTRSAGRVRMQVPHVGLFNHALVYFPSLGLYSDTTAAGHRAGELPADLLGTAALHVTDGAALQRMPSTSAAQHRLEVRMRLRLTHDPGSGALVAQGRREVHASGLFCPALRNARAGRPDAIETLALGGAALEAGDVRFDDRPGSVRLSYRLRFPLQDAALRTSLSPLELGARLGVNGRRSSAVTIAHPMTFSSRVELDHGALDAEPGLPAPAAIELPFGRYRLEIERPQPGVAVLLEELALEALEVPAEDAARLGELARLVDRLQAAVITFRP
jgi:tetratricopeptide (TPR) repeat protein